MSRFIWPFTSVSVRTHFSDCVVIVAEGDDEHSRRVRRTIMRYVHLSYWLVLIKGSSAVKKRFPTMQHLVASGIMNERELEEYERMECIDKWWLPLRWAHQILYTAHKDGRIANPLMYYNAFQVDSAAVVERHTSRKSRTSATISA